jgi:hypothetical protein
MKLYQFVSTALPETVRNQIARAGTLRGSGAKLAWKIHEELAGADQAVEIV